MTPTTIRTFSSFKLLQALLVIFFFIFLFTACQETDHDSNFHELWQTGQSDVQVQGWGKVTRLLADDTKGSQHQRFIVRTFDGTSLLIVHNIDIAPRLQNLRVNDRVEFYGEYIWNRKGGLVHWTHKDPNARHPHGWILHAGKKYW